MHAHMGRQMGLPSIGCRTSGTTEWSLVGMAANMFFQPDWFGVALLTTIPLTDVFLLPLSLI